MKNFDSIVIGGGIVGAACARELHELGQNVLVIDSSYPGTGATAACMGHVVVMDDSPSMLEFTKYSRDLWTALKDELPQNCEDFMPGTLWVAQDEEELEEAAKKSKLYSSAGVENRLLSSAEVEKLEPSLKKGLAGGLQVAEDRVVYPTNCVRYFLKEVKVIQSIKVSSVNGNTVSLENGDKYSAQSIIVAAGAHTPQLLDVKMVPKKGHLAITQRYPGFVSHQIIELGYIKKAHSGAAASTAFNIQPRKNGQMIIGSSREYSGFDSSINKKLLQEMMKCATGFLPDLKKLKCLRVWTGFRPSTPDGLPYIGRYMDSNIFVCAGHEGLGITTSLASAKMIAADVCGVECPIDFSEYSPNRELLHAH